MVGQEVIGWAGFALLVAAWIPQTWQTVKDGRTDLNYGFIFLYVISSVLLTIYAILRDDFVFIALNGILTFGSAVNLYFKIFPRNED